MGRMFNSAWTLAEWARALAGGLSACGAEGSNGRKAICACSGEGDCRSKQQ